MTTNSIQFLPILSLLERHVASTFSVATDLEAHVLDHSGEPSASAGVNYTTFLPDTQTQGSPIFPLLSQSHLYIGPLQQMQRFVSCTPTHIYIYIHIHTVRMTRSNVDFHMSSPLQPLPLDSCAHICSSPLYNPIPTYLPNIVHTSLHTRQDDSCSCSAS